MRKRPTSHDLDTGPHDPVRLKTGEDDLDVRQQGFNLFRPVNCVFGRRKVVLGVNSEGKKQEGVGSRY